MKRFVLIQRSGRQGHHECAVASIDKKRERHWTISMIMTRFVLCAQGHGIVLNDLIDEDYH